jgi:hypothetical protein
MIYIFWYPHIFMRDRSHSKALKHKVDYLDLSDETTYSSVFANLTLEEDNSIQINFLLGKSEEDIQKEETWLLPDLSIRMKCEKRSHNGFSQYEFDYPNYTPEQIENIKVCLNFESNIEELRKDSIRIANDEKLAGNLDAIFADEKATADSISTFNKKIKFWLEMPIYHGIKDFHHKHFNKDKYLLADAKIIAFVYDPSLPGQGKTDIDIASSDNLSLRECLKKYHEFFELYAHKAEEQDKKYEELVEELEKNYTEDKIAQIRNVRKECVGICEIALFEYVYYNVLKSSIYNGSFQHTNTNNLDDDNAKELRRLSFNIENAILAIKNIKDRNINRDFNVLDKVIRSGEKWQALSIKLGRIGLWLGIIGGVLGILGAVLGVLGLMH